MVSRIFFEAIARSSSPLSHSHLLLAPGDDKEDQGKKPSNDVGDDNDNQGESEKLHRSPYPLQITPRKRQ